MSKKSIDSIYVSDYNKAVFTGRTLSNQTKTVPLVSPKGVGRGREAASRATVRDLIDRIAIAGSKAISTSLSRASTLAQQQNNNDISLGLNCRADPSAGRLELTDLNSIRTLWLKKVQLLGEMKNAVTSWKNWNEQIRKFYDDGLISALGDQILDVKYKNPNDPTYEISIGDKNLEGTCRFIHGRQLSGE